jgi:truncated hemoglobin YjbI
MIDQLYDLIGGRKTVWAAIDAFYRRVLADDTLRAFFESADMGRLRARQSMFISMLLGGRIVYTGKDIAAAHAQAREQGLISRPRIDVDALNATRTKARLRPFL